MYPPYFSLSSFGVGTLGTWELSPLTLDNTRLSVPKKNEKVPENVPVPNIKTGYSLKIIIFDIKKPHRHCYIFL